MQIKELNQRVTFMERKEIGRDSEGWPLYRKTDLFSTWAKAESSGAKETENNNATFESTEITFTIRYRKSIDITGDMLIRHLNKDYEITGIELVDFGREYMKISVKKLEVQNSG